MKIKKGDTVQVMTGNDAGKTGRVIKVFPDKHKIVVEGISVVKNMLVQLKIILKVE